MGLINQAIPNLFNGVSQQPAQLRLPSQCELSENFYPTIAAGLSKRPPTEFKAKLASLASNGAFVKVMNRDAAERYVMVVLDGGIEVFDALTGTRRTVSAPSGYAYLACNSPREDIAAVTVADHTFLVNKTKTVAMGAATAPTNANTGYVVFTYYGAGIQRDMAVRVNVGGVTYTGAYSGAATDVSTAINAIQSSLSTALGAGWVVSKPFNNILRISKADGAAWSLTASDDYGNATMRAVKGSVAQFSDLPEQIDDGYICYVSPRPGEAGAGYYVRYAAASKAYIECPKPGVLTGLNAATMPHRLVRETDGSFTLTPISWDLRTVGDEESCPAPTFVGRPINDVFFYRNRLGFLSDENVILSESGNYFNFFAKSAATVLDSDPIDAAVSSNKVALLTFAVPFNKVLMPFSDQTQFQLSGGDTLTPRTVRADPVTEFASATTCRPVGAGQELFFVVDRDGYSGIREYFVDQDTLSNDAADITAHVPAYIPEGVFSLAVSTAEDCLFVLTTAERNAIYVYKYYWGADEKVQSAWEKFTLAAEDVILGAEFIGSTAYLVIKRSDGVYLETMSLQALKADPGLPFRVHLDRKVALTGTYNPSTRTTTWTLPWTVSGSVAAVLGPAFGTQAGSMLALTQASANTVTASGDWSAGAAYVGVNYTARYRLSEQHVKDRNNTTIAAAVLKLRRMSVSYVSSGYFRAEVTPPGRDTMQYVFGGKVLGVSGVLLGSPALASGQYRFPVMSGSSGVVIELVNDTALPSTFQSAEWDGELVVTVRR